MFIAFFLVWIIFNGQLTLEIACLGVIVSAAVYAFCCKFLNLSIKKDVGYCKKIGQIIHYLVVLLVEIIKANIAVVKLATSSSVTVEPAIVHFSVDLKNELALVALADSITLTPGTITVLQEGNEFTVHCLDKTLAEGLDNSIFVQLLKEIESPVK